MSVVTCPKCSARLKLDDDFDPDDQVECSRCGKQFPLPEDAATHRAKKVPRKGGCAGVGCFLLVIFFCGAGWFGWSQMKQRARDDLAAGDQLHGQGKKKEAVAKYKSAYSFAPDDRKPQVVARIVDFEATEGDKTVAREWVSTALTHKFNVPYETQAARDLHAQVQRERAEAEAKKQAEKEAKEKADKEAEEKRQRYGGEAEATTAAQMLVKKQLAFPTEARFSILGRDTVQNADKSWKVSGEVTSKNAFGTKVKYRFQVTVLRQANGDWHEVEPVTLTEAG